MQKQIRSDQQLTISLLAVQQGTALCKGWLKNLLAQHFWGHCKRERTPQYVVTIWLMVLLKHGCHIDKPFRASLT